jgi:hypothetical protein
MSEAVTEGGTVTRPRRRAIWGVTAALISALAVVWWAAGQLQLELRGSWNRDAIGATLERVIPVHNDVVFQYVLENRTNSDYKVTDEARVKIVGKSRSTGALLPKAGKHVAGDFPLTIPAGKRAHFALVWTTDRDLEAVRVDDLIADLGVSSFLAFDEGSRYEIEFPARR